MRIALFSSTVDPTNGYGNITVEFCRELKRQETAFTLFLPAAEREAHARNIPDIPGEFNLPPHVFELKNPKALLYVRTPDVSGYDLVHSLLDFPYCISAALAAKRSGRPFMMGSQGTYGVVPLTKFPDRIALEWAYSRARKIVVPSAFTKATILSYTRRPYAIDIIHNGVNVGRFTPQRDVADIRARYPGKKILLTVGGLKERKGQDLTLAALGILRRSMPDFVYLLAGKGGWKEFLRAKARECGVEDKVIFLGSLDGEELVSVFHACDVYVHTPRVAHLHFEGFGIVYLEAAACGKPSVATAAGGVADAVLDHETGFIVPDGDVGAIADRLLLLCRDDALRQRMGGAGRAYAERHDWSAIVRSYQSLYSTILG